MEFILNPWPWYVGGPLIAGILFLLLWVGRRFGMSSNLRTVCAAAGAGKASSFFDYNWKDERWNLMVALGAVIGGAIAMHFLSNSPVVDLHPETVEQLQGIGIQDAGKAFMPESLFSDKAWSQPRSLFLLLSGGFLVGIGARYAGGCTSGHAISGLSNLQLGSLIAVIGFFIGGLLMNHFLLPYLI
ncbi:MAG: YeeE/YedE family protein [Flavobacteriaceae bacterium]